MSQFVASNITFTALHAGADPFSSDDFYTVINGKHSRHVNRPAPNQTGGFIELQSPDKSNSLTDLSTGQRDIVVFDSASPSIRSLTGPSVFNNSINFQAWDDDGRFVDGVFDVFDSDDFIGQTTYVATGKEPLVGQGNFHFVNIMNASGSTYRLDYDINKLPGSTTGQLASNQGGVLNGSNKDGTLVGQGGKDIIDANNGDDLVMGAGNDDTLNGGKGDDLIFGGKGKDRLTGAQGFDTFMLARKTGFDTISDFRIGSDRVGLSGGLSFEDLSLVQQAKGTLVRAGGEQLGFLQGTKANQLSAADFTQIDMASLNSLVQSNVAQLG